MFNEVKCLSEQDIVIENGVQDKLYIGNSDKEIDGNELRLINGSVKNALSELIDSEQQDGKIRINLRKSIR